MGVMEINLSTLAKHFSDEAEAYRLVESMPWPAGTICPHCAERGNAYLLKATRKTSTGKVSDRRVWKCTACRKEFSVLVGTIFESSNVPLYKWLWRSTCSRHQRTGSLPTRSSGLST
jgi:transposase-like protein